MKKVCRILLFLLVIVCFVGCNRVQRDQERDYEYEYSSVYLLQDVKISYADGREIEVELLRNREEKDILESSVFYKDGEEYATEKYELNENYHVVSVKHEGDDDYQADIFISYNEDESISRRDVFIDGEKYSIVYEYEENGHYKKVSVFDVEEKLLSYYTFSFDKEKSEEIVEEYDRENILCSYYINLYGANDKVIKTEKYSLDDKLESTFIFNYFKYNKTTIDFGE